MDPTGIPKRFTTSSKIENLKELKRRLVSWRTPDCGLLSSLTVATLEKVVERNYLVHCIKITSEELQKVKVSIQNNDLLSNMSIE